MRTSTVSYPYPVIGNANDVEGRFIVNSFIRSVDPDYMRFDYEFEVTNKTLVDLIANNKARYVVQFECSSTFYRWAYRTTEARGVIRIKTNKLREKVTVRFFVCADDNIQDYLPAGSHSDYTGMIFNIERGDILAVGGYTTFIAEKTFDPLRAPIDSIFRIQVGTQSGEIHAMFDQDKIVVVIPKDDHKNYLQVMNRKLYDNIHAAIVLPVLIEAVRHLKESNEDYQSCRWYERLTEICIARNADVNYPFEAAQKILSNPVGRSFKQIETTLNKIDELGDE